MATKKQKKTNSKVEVKEVEQENIQSNTVINLEDVIKQAQSGDGSVRSKEIEQELAAIIEESKVNKEELKKLSKFQKFMKFLRIKK